MTDAPRLFWTYVLISSLVGTAAGWVVVWIIWRRRFDRLRDELRALSNERADLTLRIKQREGVWAEAEQQARHTQAENNELRAALTLAEVRLEKRGLRPIDELAWETKYEAAQVEIRQLRADLAAAQRRAGEPDSLESISGIGKVFASRLSEAGIQTFADLARQSPERVRQVVQAAEWQAIDPEDWIEQARQRAGLA